MNLRAQKRLRLLQRFAIPVFVVFAIGSAVAQAPPAPIHGITVDDKNDIRDPHFLSQLLDSIGHLSVKPTVRIVYKPGNDHGPIPAGSYVEATEKIRGTGYVMAQPVDSFYMKCFSPAEHLARFKEYVSALNSYVDIWEVGNEINGDWLFGDTKACVPKASVSATTQEDVVLKMTQAFDFLKSKHKRTALTLYYNAECGAPPAYEMFSWAQKNVPPRMKDGLDYVLVSYYELDCHGYKPDWQSMFRRIAETFPNSKLGISEFGWAESAPAKSVLADLIVRHYAIHPDVRGWVGGGFYWEFADDMIPYDPAPDSLWSTINTALANQK